MGNANDRRQVQYAQTVENAVRKTEKSQLREVMNTSSGRAVIWRLIENTKADTPTEFNTNAMLLSRDVGVASVGFAMLEAIRESCPELEFIMRQEAAAQRQRIADQEEASHANDTR